MQRKGQRENAPPRPADFSDAGNAAAFVKYVSGRLLWCDALGWLAWNGRLWSANEHAAVALAADFSKVLLDEALAEYRAGLRTDELTGKLNVDDAAAKFYRHAQASRSARAIKSMLELSKPALHVRAEALDADPHLLNTAAGIIDLRTGAISPHDPEKLCTKIAPFSPSDEGSALWQSFLDQITLDDESAKKYHQLVAGMCAYGTVFVEGVIIHIGGGRNGKSTFNNALVEVFGAYAGAIDSTLLTTERQNRGAGLATLRGKRFVVCGELEDGQRLSTQTLKRLASTDGLTIEEKYRSPEVIRPSHHIILHTNSLPRVSATDNGTWRRLTVVPFNAVMPSGENDIPNYAALLVEKAGGAILSWIIEGARRFYEAGYRIVPPPAVVRATADYRRSEDWLQGFINACCLVDANARVRRGELYSAYQNYAAVSGEFCRRAVDFAQALEVAGYSRVIVRGAAFWRGISLAND